MDEHTIKCNTETRRNKEQVKNIKHIVPPNPKEKQGTSPTESPILLRREIPMAWGTTTDRLPPEINPSLYARETKGLTQLYIACLSCLLNVEEAIYQYKLELESSTGIYINRPYMQKNPLFLCGPRCIF